MPIRIPDSLPAHAILEAENIFVMTEHRAMHQDIRPLNVLILNLMPTKIITETQLLRKLSNTPLQICVDFLQTASYTSTHTDPEHLKQFYYTFDQIKDRRYDGMIMTMCHMKKLPTGMRSAKSWNGQRHTFTVHSICVGELMPDSTITTALKNLILTRNCLASFHIRF